MKRTTKLTGIYCAMALLLAGSLATAYISGNVVNSYARVVHDRETVMARLEGMLSALREAENGERGFLLTGDAETLQPYVIGLAKIRPDFELLRDALSSEDVGEGQVKELERLITRKWTSMNETIALRRAGRTDEAIAEFKGVLAEHVMRQIRIRIEGMSEAFAAERDRAIHAALIAENVRTWVFILAIAVNLAFLFWAWRRTQSEMSDSERQRELLETTLASIGDGVIITDMERRVTFLNKVAEDMTGWSLAEARHKPCREIFNIINETSRARVESPVDKVLETGTIVGLANHTLLVGKDGRETPIDDCGAPIRKPGGKIEGVVLVFRDFTSHKESAAALERTRRDLEVSNAAKDDFLAALSHELRTPLTPVLATLSLLMEDRGLPPELKAKMTVMRRNVELETRLIDDLLDLTRISRGRMSLKLETADINEIASLVTGIFESDAKSKGISLILKPDARSPWVQADVARLQQVMWNLIGNALKFSGPGDRITLATANDAAGNVLVTVSDTGAGMSGETLEGLFKPFERVVPESGRGRAGLGIGLSICKALVESHQGVLVATSAGPGAGSSFTMTLPSTEAPRAAGPEVKTEAVPGDSSAPLRILLVEDHRDSAETLAALLNMLGHTAVIAGSVAQGLETFRSQPFDLILSDVGLPDGRGIDLIKKIRQTSSIRAIALTGYGMEEDVKECLNAGFEKHLTKPVSFEQILEIVGSASA